MATASCPALPWDGGCRCDRMRIQVTAPPILTAACHCRGCQRMSASAFSLTIMVPEQGLVVTRGEPVVGGLHGADLHHMFCAHCMTWVFTRPVGYGFVNVRPTMLDDARWFAPFIETGAEHRLPWATTGAVHSYDQFPPPAAFAALLAEYAAWAPPISPSQAVLSS